MDKRGAGILLHITSLPSRYGIGDLGPEAYRFADFLCEAGLRFWEILPLNPTDLLHDNSPYKSVSAFAFNANLISPVLLAEDGFINAADIPRFTPGKGPLIDYPAAVAFKAELLKKAFDKFANQPRNRDFIRFCEDNAYWLDDYAFFCALKSRFDGVIWNQWPEPVRDRHEKELAEYRRQLTREIEKEKFFQFLFMLQWRRLKQYCLERNIKIIGDIPIYVALDSADVWTHPSLFKLDRNKQPLFIAGVPPDYFSETGQLWGNPVYRWDELRKSGYAWWLKRLEHNLALFDIVRIDHFRGLVGYWQVKNGSRTAIDGEWIDAPADDFLGAVVKSFADLPVIAEDLGLITPDVQEIMKKYSLPGMKVLQFGFSGSLAENEHALHNAVKNCFLFTGTHDNNTARGWYTEDITREEKRNLNDYLGRKVNRRTVGRELIRAAMMSAANTVIVPLQDFLGLGSSARMNRPFINEGNWRWRLRGRIPGRALARRIRHQVKMYGRQAVPQRRDTEENGRDSQQ